MKAAHCKRIENRLMCTIWFHTVPLVWQLQTTRRQKPQAFIHTRGLNKCCWSLSVRFGSTRPMGIKACPTFSTYPRYAAPDVASQQVKMSGDHTGTMAAFIILPHAHPHVVNSLLSHLFWRKSFSSITWLTSCWNPTLHWLTVLFVHGILTKNLWGFCMWRYHVCKLYSYTHVACAFFFFWLNCLVALDHV